MWFLGKNKATEQSVQRFNKKHSINQGQVAPQSPQRTPTDNNKGQFPWESINMALDIFAGDRGFFSSAWAHTDQWLMKINPVCFGNNNFQ